MKLLKLTSGLFGDNSQSTQLANHFVERLQSVNSDLQLTNRDLISEPIPHLDATIISAFMSEPNERTSEQTDIVNFSNALIEEIKQADSIVLGLPMYNFGVPSQLKAYFDQLARAGVTFKYTDTGPVGLLEDKPVYVLAARGGLHQGLASDSQTGFIKTMFQFLGLKNVNIIYAEGLNMGESTQSQAIETAHKMIESEIA